MTWTPFPSSFLGDEKVPPTFGRPWVLGCRYYSTLDDCDVYWSLCTSSPSLRLFRGRIQGLHNSDGFCFRPSPVVSLGRVKDSSGRGSLFVSVRWCHPLRPRTPSSSRPHVHTSPPTFNWFVVCFRPFLVTVVWMLLFSISSKEYVFHILWSVLNLDVFLYFS